MATVVQLVDLYGLTHEILMRVANGSLDEERVKASLEAVIRTECEPGWRITHPYFGPSNFSPPSWWRAAERQLECVRQFNEARGWGFADADFPAIPVVEMERTEVLLLAVYLPDKGNVSGVQRTFDEHVAVIQQQAEGREYGFLQSDDPKHLQLQGPSVHKPGLRWVAYDYAAHQDANSEHAVEDLWNVATQGLAASEVLSALMLFPGYGPSMADETVPYANLPGYDMTFQIEQSDTSYCPCVSWLRHGPRLQLDFFPPDCRSYDYASPVVREC